MTAVRGLTWSRKWHVVDEVRSEKQHNAMALCGAPLYLATDNRLPDHLKRIFAGTAQGEGICRKCVKQPAKTGKVTVELPPLAPQGHLDARWEVPLYSAILGRIDEREHQRGEVWIGKSDTKLGKIVVTSVPSILETADDARRLAAALLAAAEWKDRNDDRT